MKKSILINVLMILMGLCLLIAASFNKIGIELLTTALSGAGAIMIAVGVFDIAKCVKDKDKTRRINQNKKR
ncbi:MAG: hypothetical protein RSB78_04730 [Oscillospiraceae bacterium]